MKKRVGYQLMNLTLLLMLAALLGGCVNFKGGTGPEVDMRNVLHQHGLDVTLETDKDVYRKGEPIRMWLAVNNTGTRARDLQLHTFQDDPGKYTYKCNIFLASAHNSYPGVWGVHSADFVSMRVQPGQTVRLVELEWDQSSKTAQPVVVPGTYDIGIELQNLFVDGRKLQDIDSFTVLCIKLIRITE